MDKVDCKQLIYKQAAEDYESRFGHKILEKSKFSNIDLWGKDSDHNTLYITGYSGSGKSTAAKSLAGKNTNILHMDTYIEKIRDDAYIDQEFDKYLENNFPDYRGEIGNREKIKMHTKEFGDYLDKLQNSIDGFSKQQYEKGKNVIVEGIQLYDETLYPDKTYFKDKPLVIVGTNPVTSFLRASGRDEKPIFKSLESAKDHIKWYSDAHKSLDNLKDITSAKRNKDIDYYKRLIHKQAALNEDVEFNALQKRIVDNPNNSMIIAHPVGSGKTLSGIAKFEKLKEQGKANRALVITPAGLRHNFANEGISKFTNSSVNIIGNKGEINKKQAFNPNPDSDYNVVSYEMFRRNPKRYIKDTGADTVILDEIHRLKNEGTSTLDGFNEIKGDYNNFIGLTGSVISNKISDIYNLIDLSSQGKHNLGESKTKFEDKFYKRSTNPSYKGLHKSRIPVVGFKNIGVLKKDLTSYVDYADIDEVRDISKIPDKILKVKKVPLSKEQTNYYKRLVKNDPKLRELIQKKRFETMKDDEVARAYSQLAEARKLVNSVGSVVPGINLQESIDRSPKTKLLLDDLEKHLQTTPDGQAIVMSHLINGGADILEAGLKDRGMEYGKFIGKGNKGVTETTRQQDIEDYKDRLKRVMLISGAGGEGISLGDTTWEGVLDGHYNPEKMNQMEARGIRAHGLSHRPESEREVLVNRYISTMPKTLGIIPSSMKTPDEIIYEIAERKDRQNQLMYNLLKKNQKKRR